MDPISTAVITAVAKLGEPAVKDAYEALKALIRRKLGAESKLGRAVEDLEGKPTSEARQAVLREEVSDAKAEVDDELVQAAREVLQRVTASGGSTVSVHATGDRAVAIGGDVHGGIISTGDQNPAGGQRGGGGHEQIPGGR